MTYRIKIYNVVTAAVVDFVRRQDDRRIAATFTSKQAAVHVCQWLNENGNGRFYAPEIIAN